MLSNRSYLRRLLLTSPIDQSWSALYDIIEEAVNRTHTTLGGILALISENQYIQIFKYGVCAQGRIRTEVRDGCAATNENLTKAFHRASVPQVIRRDAHPHSDFYFSESRVALQMAIVEDGRPVGLLQLEASDPGQYSEFDLLEIHTFGAEAAPCIQRALLRNRLKEVHAPVEVVGMSDAFLRLERRIRQVASINYGSVFLTGERGSGKELAAWAMHCWSDRHENIFVPVLASALPDHLFWDELFGHERGAFTGAEQRRLGKLQAAENGTIFIDEVADLTPAMQSALLRFLDTGEVVRLGRDLPKYINVRVITATNQQLEKLVAEKRFRQDLYDRLTGFTVKIPPVRERSDDIEALASHFLKKICSHTNCKSQCAECPACPLSEHAKCATPEFYSRLRDYDWPGNIRQLKSVMLQLKAATPRDMLDGDVLGDTFPACRNGSVETAHPISQSHSTLHAVTRHHIEYTLARSGYNQTHAAEVLGVPLSTLRNKMKRLGITVMSNRRNAQMRGLEA